MRGRRRDTRAALGAVLAGVRPGALVAAILVAAVPCPGATLVPTTPGVAPVAIEISGKGYRYYPVTAGRPLAVTVDGPAAVTFIARWRFEDARTPVDVRADVLLDGAVTFTHIARAYPGSATYVGESGWAAGKASHIEISVPAGRHDVGIALVEPAQGVLDVNPVLRTPRVHPWRVAWRGALAAAYDSNVFRYSDQDVDDFLDGEREDRFPIDAVDDLRLEPSVRVALARGKPGARETELSASADFRLASVNGEKSFARLGVRFLERREGTAFLEAEYAAIPSYLIRDVWDADAAGGNGAYRPCEYRKHGVALSAGSDRALPIDLEATLRYEVYQYNPDFIEYDARVTTTGLTAVARPRKGLRLDVGYTLRRSIASATDEDGETRTASDDSDTSYDQDEYHAAARLEAGRFFGLPTVVSLRGKLANRLYQTPRSGGDDPYHAGREDALWTASATASFDLGGGRRLEAFVEGRGRTVESPFVLDIGDTKDYTGTRVGLRLTAEGERLLD